MLLINSQHQVVDLISLNSLVADDVRSAFDAQAGDLQDVMDEDIGLSNGEMFTGAAMGSGTKPKQRAIDAPFHFAMWLAGTSPTTLNEPPM